LIRKVFYYKRNMDPIQAVGAIRARWPVAIPFAFGAKPAVSCRRKHEEDNVMLTRRAMLSQVTAAGGAAFALGAGVANAAVGGSATNFAIPRGATDCHVHVFGETAKFPFAATRGYTPPPASVEQLLELQGDLHMERVVVVQPSVYGTDNACTLDGVKRMGARARAIVVIDKSTPRSALQEMAGAGARGIRLNLSSSGNFDPNSAKQQLDQVAEQLRGLNWHVQMYVALSIISTLKD
jgi:hypothetical protein